MQEEHERSLNITFDIDKDNTTANDNNLPIESINLPPRKSSLKHSSIQNMTETASSNNTAFNTAINASILESEKPLFIDLTAERYPKLDESVYQRYFSSDIHDYELIAPTGVEETAFIYLARYNPTGEYVALRYTDLTIAPDVEFLDELFEHVKNTKLHRHPCIIPYYISFVESERLWSVTYPMRAGSLKKIVKEHFPNGLSEKLVATIIKEVLRALVYLHNQNLIHGNVRANHILLDCTGEVKLTGLTSCLSLINKKYKIEKSTFSFVGLPDWMAPEMMSQNRPFDTKVDIYSLGITTRELLTGMTPFDGWPPLKIMYAKLAPHYCKALSFVEFATPICRDFLRQCCHPFPSHRPSAEDLLQHPFIVKKSRSLPYLKSKIVKVMNLPPEWFTDADISRPTSPMKSCASSDDSLFVSNNMAIGTRTTSYPLAPSPRPKSPVKLLDDFFIDPEERTDA